MPRPGCSWATRSDWLRFYRVVKDTGEVTMGDDRTWAPSESNPELLWRADALIARGITNPQRVVVLGCGPGAFLVEALKARGMTNVWGVDSSPWADSRRAVMVGGVAYLTADFTGNIANALRTLTGDRGFDWIVTESVFESYDDNDITVGLNACEGLRSSPQVPMSHIIHLVYTPPFNAANAGVFNEKSMAQWKAMRSTHTWMNAEGYAVA